MTTVSFTSVADSWVKEDNNPDTNYGTDDEMGVKPDAGKIRRSFVQFDVSSIPGGATVTSATLTLCISREREAHIHELRNVTESWAETAVTFNNQPTVSATVTDTITVPGAIGCVTFTVTSNVQAWVATTASNGWRISHHNEGTATSPLTIPSVDGGQDGSPDTIIAAGDGPLAGGVIPITALQSGEVVVGGTCSDNSLLDSDGDGYTDANEGVIVTDADDPCANTPDPDDEADDRWPSDFDDNQVINILDVNMTLPPFFGYVCT